MLNVVSTKIPREELQKRMGDIRVCSICRHGVWVGEQCQTHPATKRIRIREYINIIVQRKTKVKRLKRIRWGVKCVICG